MIGAGEVFLVQLARVSRRALRVISQLQKEEREDVLAEALTWCWEHKEQYSLVTTLDTWFVNAVRDAYRRWLRGEARNSSALRDVIPTGDTTYASVEAASAARVLLASFPRAYRRVAWLEAQGYSRKEMIERGIRERAINETRERVKQLRRLLPDTIEYRETLRTTPLPLSDDSCPDDEQQEPVESAEALCSDELGGWVRQQPGRVVNRLRMFTEWETFSSRMRAQLNRREGLEPSYMPTYVPTKHWRE